MLTAGIIIHGIVRDRMREKDYWDELPLGKFRR